MAKGLLHNRLHTLVPPPPPYYGRNQDSDGETQNHGPDKGSEGGTRKTAEKTTLAKSPVKRK